MKLYLLMPSRNMKFKNSSTLPITNIPVFLQLSAVTLIILVVSLPSTTAHPVPKPIPLPEESTSNFFKSITSWVDPDKIPSIEVKLGYDGVSVSTGPSREQIYWTIALSIGGVCLIILLVIIAIFCCWNKRRRNRTELTVWNAPRTRVHVDVPGSFMVLNPTLGTPIRGPATRSGMASRNSYTSFQQPQIFTTESSREFVNMGHGIWNRK